MRRPAPKALRPRPTQFNDFRFHLFVNPLSPSFLSYAVLSFQFLFLDSLILYSSLYPFLPPISPLDSSVFSPLHISIHYLIHNSCIQRISLFIHCLIKFLRLAIIHSFIPAISIAPIQVFYYSKALPTTARVLYRSFTPKRTATADKELAQGQRFSQGDRPPHIADYQALMLVVRKFYRQ